ncbi:MAG: hypothetical protein M3R27_14085 [Bacteroidota bacterium]|nr:hypothetical protein [Bacteroidota bacterium]
MKFILRLFPILLLFACQTADKNQTILQKKSDLSRSNLNGPITELRQDYYKAEEKEGKIVQGEKSGNDENNFLIRYNEQGDMIEKNAFYRDGTLLYKLTFSYDKEGKLTEENRFNSDGTTNYKKKYTYSGNIREVTSYKADGEMYSKDTVFTDQNGNDIAIRNYNQNNTLTLKVDYKYDSKRNVIEKIHNGEGTYTVINSTYDEKGNSLQDSLYSHLFSAAFTDTTRVKRSLKYDTQNNTTEIVYFYPKAKYTNDQKTSTTETFKYVYDEKNNWISKTCFEDGKPTYLALRKIIYK